MSDTEMIEERLRSFIAAPDDADWQDVLRRVDAIPGATREVSRAGFMHARRRWRPVLVAAVAVAALVGVGVAIAAGFGAFNGISATQHLPTAADKLDPAVAASLAAHNLAGLELDSARFVTQLADGIRIYAVATKTGGLCAVAERLPNNNGKNDASTTECGSPLTQSQPTTAVSFQPNEQAPVITWGIALDSVTAVSFTAGGQVVTVPVKNNVWAYEGDNAAFGTLIAHFKDGSTETIG